MAKQLGDRILDYLDKHNKVNSLDLASVFDEDHQKIIGAVKSLEAVPNLVTVHPVTQKKWEITAEGQHILQNGSYEAAVYNAVPEDGILQSDLMKSKAFSKIGFSKALVAGWIEIQKNNSTAIVKKKVPSIIDNVQEHLKEIPSIPENVKVDYKKRKLLQEITIKSILLEKGPNFSTRVEKLETELTADLLVNGSWKEKKFKPYNFDALGAALEIGHLHPLMKVRAEFRKIFIEMGFTEMPTNNFVESSFWNFDALFQPQQHPARDAHDTFFVSEPRLCTNFPMDYLEKVKNVHSVGGYGSQGYCYDWKLEEAQKNLLRTHTTAVSARMLYKLMQEGEFKPVKYFSIDRVFRNETLDATHLAEFHQVEGVIADYNLTLGNLIGMLYEFFKKLGITRLQFKPAYNPYTEPSMEIFCYHDGLGKWIEIGNSGMFRPEMLLPMGIPEDVNVIAWGLSLERPTMIKYGLNNIRDLVGPKVDMEMVHNNPICRLDKISGQTAHLMDKLEEPEQTLQKSVHNLGEYKKEIDDQQKNVVNEVPKQNLIVFCDPNYPMYSLEKLLSLAKLHLNISVSVHVHSSVRNSNNLLKFCYDFQSTELDNHMQLTLIWKTIGIDPIMHLPGMHEIIGEVNIARYINRLIELTNPNVLKYETNGPLYASQIDSYLENIHGIIHGTVHGNIKDIPKKSCYIMGEDISLVDIILESMSKSKSNKK